MARLITARMKCGKHQFSADPVARERQTPKPKRQKKFQSPKFNPRAERHFGGFGRGHWDFFGVWVLVFGVHPDRSGAD
jgi:hypothetical protein